MKDILTVYGILIICVLVSVPVIGYIPNQNNNTECVDEVSSYEITYGDNRDDTLYASVIDHIKSYEGFRSKRYRDTDGNWTIGYGHHIGKGEYHNDITETIAEKLLVADLTRCVKYVEKVTDLRGEQSLAIGMLAFNCGTGKVKSYIDKGLLNNIKALPRYCHYTNLKGERVRSDKLRARREFELKVYTNGL